MARKKVQKKPCIQCKKDKALNREFYQTNNPLFPDGRLPICIQCLVKLIDERDVSTLIDVLRKIDKPFIKKAWESAKKSEQNTCRAYFRQINSLKDYKDLTFADSDNTDSDYDDVDFEVAITTGNGISEDEEVRMLKAKWGDKYKIDELKRMEEFYGDMMRSNDIVDPHHKEMLKDLCKLNIEKERALSEGNAKVYRDLSNVYKDILKDSGLRPVDKQGSNEQRGIRNFGTIWAEVEKRGFIEPWPVDVSQDIIDAELLFYINHVRKFNNMEELLDPPEDIPKNDEILQEFHPEYYERTRKGGDE